jgi:hypothetical protein
MTGYRVVFDREKLVLAWKKFDCYDIEETNTTVAGTNKTAAVAPAMAAGIKTHNNSSELHKTNQTISKSNSSPNQISKTVDVWSFFRFVFILLPLV